LNSNSYKLQNSTLHVTPITTVNKTPMDEKKDYVGLPPCCTEQGRITAHGALWSMDLKTGKLLGKAVSLARFVEVESHAGSLPDRDLNCQFVRVTNRSINRKAVLTHVWFELGVEVPVLNDERPMPHVLPPEEVWETWIRLELIPESLRMSAATLARVRLSDGTVLSAKPTEHVLEAGFVAGGGKSQ
jgi:hypothetical protein